MGGTRYNARGIDDQGNCSNHTEIEQIVITQKEHSPPLCGNILKTVKMYSHVQVRGSMPFFWTQ